MRKSVKKISTAIEEVDTRFLESLIGYNARRAALAIIGEFLEKMAVYGLKPVDFSVMSVIVHNPGVTSRQLCASLNILPPNLVSLIQSLDARGLIERLPTPMMVAPSDYTRLKKAAHSWCKLKPRHQSSKEM
jgi:hypothetical protein